MMAPGAPRSPAVRRKRKVPPRCADAAGYGATGADGTSTRISARNAPRQRVKLHIGQKTQQDFRIGMAYDHAVKINARYHIIAQAHQLRLMRAISACSMQAFTALGLFDFARPRQQVSRSPYS